MEYLCCIVGGYLIGTLSPSYFMGRAHGYDIREKGSGNAGASNTLLVVGKLSGVLCALLDISKAVFAIWLAGTLFPELTYGFAVTGVSCILGHVFPFYLKFRGGKGVACLAGMVLAYDWRVFLVMFVIEIAIALISNYICFVALTASAAFPVIYGVMRRSVWGALILLVSTVVIVCKHFENLRRIRRGQEARMSVLWNKEKEIERLSQNR